MTQEISNSSYTKTFPSCWDAGIILLAPEQTYRLPGFTLRPFVMANEMFEQGVLYLKWKACLRHWEWEPAIDQASCLLQQGHCHPQGSVPNSENTSKVVDIFQTTAEKTEEEWLGARLDDCGGCRDAAVPMRVNSPNISRYAWPLDWFADVAGEPQRCSSLH